MVGSLKRTPQTLLEAISFPLAVPVKNSTEFDPQICC